VNAGYAAGKNRKHEGIDVDACNNVYVGGQNKVHVYSFNGTSFTAGTALTSTITNEVYDIRLGQMNKIYVCGAGFVSELLLTSSPCNQITLAISATNSSCSGSTGSATVTPSGGTAPYTYLWNPGGQTTATATGLASGTYTVIVSDASSPCNPNGSVSTATVTVVSVGNFSVTSTQSNTSCNGGNNGSSTAAVSGGTAPYTYSWSPSGGTNATATGLSAGIFTVTVTDASGCTNTQTVNITQPVAITATTTSTPSSCGGNVGTATVNASGGTGALTYSWSPGGQITTTATGLAAGNYSALITDANGCTGSQTVTVNQPSSIAATATATPTPCGASSGTATVIGSGGVAPFTYSWFPSGQTNATATGLAAGTYTAIVTDAGGCSMTATATVTTAGGPVASISAAVTITAGSSTTLTAGGGGTYSWSSGENTSSITVAPSATTVYCVTVTDASSNCTDTACVIVTVLPEPIDCSPSVTGEMYLPNAFSPNGDNENEVISIYYGSMQCIRTFELHIYNRWGEVVFETTSPVASWDGSYKGKVEGTAVFTYYMKAELITGTEIVKKGNISLMK
jgi:gliding motility-associated-like protein